MHYILVISLPYSAATTLFFYRTIL